MVKKKGNAGSKKASAATKAKRSAAKAQKIRAAKDAASVKAVLDAEAQRAGETAAVDESADPVDDEAHKSKRKPGRQKGDASPQAEVERQEHIKEAMEYRLMGYTHRPISEQMDVAPSTFYKWVSAGLAAITQETAEELRRVMMEQCHQKLMPLLDETAPKDILDAILKVQQQQMKLAGLLVHRRIIQNQFIYIRLPMVGRQSRGFGHGDGK